MNIPTYLIARNIHGPCFTSPFLRLVKKPFKLLTVPRNINIFFMGIPIGLPLFDHLRSVFFSTHIYYDNIVRWHHLSNFHFTSIYPCTLSCLVVRFDKAFCFSASSSSVIKICREKESEGGT